MLSTRRLRRTLVWALLAVTLAGVGVIAAAFGTGHMLILARDGDLTVAVTSPLPPLAAGDTVGRDARADALRGRTVVQSWPASETHPAFTAVLDLDPGEWTGSYVPATSVRCGIITEYVTAVATHAWGIPRRTVVQALAPLAIATVALIVLPALRIRRRGHALALVACAVLVIDQGSKYLGWRLADGAIINDRGTVLMPASLAELAGLYAAPFTGAILDIVSVGLLAAGLWLLWRRPRTPTTMLGGLLIWSGWASNLTDRLGMTALTAPGMKRGVVDWIGTGDATTGQWNVADLAIIGGVLVMVAGLAVARLQPTDRSKLVGGVTLAAVVLLAGFGAMRGGPTQETTCVPADARSTVAPGVAGTRVAALTVSTGEITCAGTSTEAARVVTAFDADGVVLASTALDEAPLIIVDGTRLRSLNTEGAVRLIPDEPGGVIEGGTWVGVTEGLWLLADEEPG